MTFTRLPVSTSHCASRASPPHSAVEPDPHSRSFATVPSSPPAEQNSDAAHFAKIQQRKKDEEERKRTEAAAEHVVLNDISFQKGRLLGVGTFGKVYEAISLLTGEIIAVKQIELKTKRAEETAKAVEQEIRMMEGLRHPNVVRLLGFNVTERVMNVIMEFVPGNSLDDVLQNTGALHEALIRRYVKQMLHALDYCHGRGVLHRDIKAKNILLHTNGQIKLADFGSAKVVENVTNKDDPSSNYAYTPLWVAPEVMTGAGYNSKVDIWSIGCVVIELSSAKEPWAERNFDSPFAALYYIATHRDAMPHIPSTLSAEGHDFIHQCLTRDVDARPSASALLKHAFITDEWKEAPEGAATNGARAPAPTPQSTGDVQTAGFMETQSALQGTAELSGLDNGAARVSGEYVPAAAHTCLPFTVRMEHDSLGSEGERGVHMVDESAQTQRITSTAQEAAMTCPILF